MSNNIYDIAITVNNVTTIDTEYLFKYFYEKYDSIVVVPEINSYKDLEKVSKLITYSSNVKRYLNTLKTYVDTVTRSIKRDKEKKDYYDDLMAKKAILNAYYENMDDIYKACSRLVSIYVEERKEIAEEKRNDNWEREFQSIIENYR